jgi:hypothetical protein
MTNKAQSFQLVWGIALVLAGIGVFYRIPQVMPRIEAAGYFSDALGFVRFCFYFLGAALLVGGAKKLIGIYRQPSVPADAADRSDNGPTSP